MQWCRIVINPDGFAAGHCPASKSSPLEGIHESYPRPDTCRAAWSSLRRLALYESCKAPFASNSKPKRSAQETQAVCRESGISFCLLGLRHYRGDSTFPVKIGGRCAGSSHTPPYFTTPTHGSPSLSPMVDRAPGREGARERLSDRAAQVGQALEVPARPQRCVQDVARPQQLLPARHSVERRILAQPVRPQ